MLDKYIDPIAFNGIVLLAEGGSSLIQITSKNIYIVKYLAPIHQYFEAMGWLRLKLL